MLGGSDGPAEIEDRFSDEAALASLVGAGPASEWKAGTLPEVAATAGVVRLFAGCPGETCSQDHWIKHHLY